MERTISLPPIAHPKVRKAAAEYEQRATEREQLAADRFTLTARRPAAQSADLRAAADAITAGKPDPGRKHTERLEAEIDAATWRLEALELALADARGRLEAAVEQHRGEWRAQLDRDARQHAEALRAAVSVVREAYATLGQTRAVAGWLEGFPGRVKWSPGGGAVVPSLTQVNGSPMSVDHVIAALLEVAEPPAPAQPRMLVETDRATGRQLRPHGPLIERVA